MTRTYSRPPSTTCSRDTPTPTPRNSRLSTPNRPVGGQYWSTPTEYPLRTPATPAEIRATSPAGRRSAMPSTDRRRPANAAPRRSTRTCCTSRCPCSVTTRCWVPCASPIRPPRPTTRSGRSWSASCSSPRSHSWQWDSRGGSWPQVSQDRSGGWGPRLQRSEKGTSPPRSIRTPGRPSFVRWPRASTR